MSSYAWSMVATSFTVRFNPCISHNGAMLRGVLSIIVLVLSCALATLMPSEEAKAACLVESPAGGKAGPLVTHVSADCTLAERELNAVHSAAVMDAIAKGRPVDLIGVVVKGDLSFDSLAVQTSQRPKGLTLEQRSTLSQLNVGGMLNALAGGA